MPLKAKGVRQRCEAVPEGAPKAFGMKKAEVFQKVSGFLQGCVWALKIGAGQLEKGLGVHSAVVQGSIR